MCKFGILYFAGLFEQQKNVEDEISIEDNIEESSSSMQERYWYPDCPDEYKPYIGQSFDTTEDAFKYYERYAVMGGFSVRRSTGDKNNKYKYFLCHKEGYTKPNSKNMTADKGRRITRSTRCGCHAKLCLKFGKYDKYHVYRFEEKHTHVLASEIGKQFLKENRKLTYTHQALIMDCGNANIGPSKAYRMMKEMTGRYTNIGATLTDFKNFKRDLMTHVKGCDAQMVVDHLENKKTCCEGFFFEWFSNDEGTLERLFWADKISRIDCIEFGDVMSFDATYSTNK